MMIFFRPATRFRPWQVVPAVAVAVIAGFLVALTFAAGPAATFLVKNGALSGNATVVANSGAIGGSMVRFGGGAPATPAPTVTATPAGSQSPTVTPVPASCSSYAASTTFGQCGFPAASTTGPAGCGSYTQYSGTLNVTTDGTVLNCIQLNGTLTINASNVTVQNSILTGTSWWGVRFGNVNKSATNFKLLHSKLQTVAGAGPDNGGYDYGIAQEASGSIEVAYNDISGYKDGVTVHNGWVHDNYIHGLSQFAGAHTQCLYVYTSGSQVKIEHNTLINDSPQSQATAAIYIAPDDGHQNNRLVTNNWMAGGAYVLYGGDSTATNIAVSNNKFSTERNANGGYFGAVSYWQAGNVGNVWSGNIWANGSKAGQALTP